MAAGAMLLATALPAIYVRSELEEVPLDRLIDNAEARVEEAPGDAFALHTLARIHAMAYAWELGDGDTVAAGVQNDGLLVPSFGYEPPWVPWVRPRQSTAPEPRNGGGEGHGSLEEAREHLEASIALYRKTLEVEPENTTARLGLAWTLIELAERDEARELLREIVAEAAPRELERGGHLGPLLAVEAIGYLLPLLDPAGDRQELAELSELRDRLEALPRAVTPIVIALRAGLRPWELVDATRPVRFDLDGSGRELPWPWLDPDAAAWLVWDRHGDGGVSSGLQLFGSRSFGLFFVDGYQALELLDDDRDGALRGEELDGLALWRDADRDGVADPGEVVAAGDAGIVAIGCRSTARIDDVLGAPGSVELGGDRRLDTWDLVLETATVPAPASGSRLSGARTTPPA
ncbi:MAG TPA: tetratricopeptide repeat protein [Thermoanaerobaculia bacterium]|nr:tetratricopeptide repeat protein [Thermoanaerobaculia bacterium]